MGYDRPSSKLLSFLRKHFNLANYHQQVNNFVVYDAYFKNTDPKHQAIEKAQNMYKGSQNVPKDIGKTTNFNGSYASNPAPHKIHNNTFNGNLY